VITGGTNNDGPEEQRPQKMQVAAKAVHLLPSMNGWFLREVGRRSPLVALVRM
jgi:hypothetical protein